jgi:acyl carrier protein
VVVNPWQRGEGDAVLVAYVVAAENRVPSETALRAHAEAQLPAAMIPAYVVILDKLPLTPNGKVDRKALPIPGAAELTDETHEQPATALEELVTDVWRKVLGVERIGARDRFFDLGGNSLTTIQVAIRIRELLGIELPLRVIFEAATVGELAAQLERRLLANADAVALETLLNELEQPAVGTQRAASA